MALRPLLPPRISTRRPAAPEVCHGDATSSPCDVSDTVWPDGSGGASGPDDSCGHETVILDVGTELPLLPCSLEGGDGGAHEGAYSRENSVYYGAVRLLDWGNSAKSGMHVKVRLLDVAVSDRHPFRDLRWSARPGEGHRLRVVISMPDDNPMIVTNLPWNSEATLGWWADDCAHGVNIRLKMDSGPDGVTENPLSGMVTGSKTGQSLFLACWAIGDDEMPEVVSQARARPSRKKIPFNESDATRQAAIKCADKEFRLWCFVEGVRLLDPAEIDCLPVFEADEVGFAAEVIRVFCRVASRSELRQPGPCGEEARRRWTDMMGRQRAWRSNR